MVDSVRCHWLPLDPKSPRRFLAREMSLAKDPRVVCVGRDAETDLIALVARRLVEGGRTLPLQAWRHTSASGQDLGRLLEGGVDLSRTMGLARALSALDWRRVRDSDLPAPVRGTLDLEPTHIALRLAHLPFDVAIHGAPTRIPVDPSPLRLLAAGESSRAFEVVARRLRGVGLLVPYRAASMDPRFARRLAASLAFPISSVTASSFARLLEHPTHKEFFHAR